MTDVPDEILLARAYLTRIAEPANVELWGLVRDHGPVAAVQAIRSGDVSAELRELTEARAATTNPHADLEAADRRGIRLVTPESAEWPHIAMGALDRAGALRLAARRDGHPDVIKSGEPVPPLALWVRGACRLDTLSLRSVAIVGARAATPYGDRIAKDLGHRLALRDFDIVSGGAYGIDAAAHRGALAAGGRPILVSAAGADRVYPSGNRALFDQVAEQGAILSEGPPATAPHRHRFLTRNRLIVALSTGTVVVEAAARSGAKNTAQHCKRLDRPLMAVPGPVSSAMSVGCHDLIRDADYPAQLITSVQDVLALIGSIGEFEPGPAGDADVRPVDRLDADTRRVLDGFPARGPVSVDTLIVTSGEPTRRVLRAIPQLELHGFVRAVGNGLFERSLGSGMAS